MALLSIPFKGRQ